MIDHFGGKFLARDATVKWASCVNHGGKGVSLLEGREGRWTRLAGLAVGAVEAV